MAREAGQFERGRSGNPAGKAKGTRNRTTLVMEELLAGEAEAITRKAIELALEGDGPALRLCMERLVPARRDRPVQFEMPPIATVVDLPRATDALLKAVAAGDITPSEAADVGRAVDAHVKAVETADIAERLRRIEEGGSL